MVNITENKDYILVHVEGAKFNIEGILSKILDKSYLKYKTLNGYFTLFTNCDNSFFAHGLRELISHSKNDGIWYENTWSYVASFGPYTGVMDSLFYDEFVFLMAEDLITFDNIELLTDNDIWRNAENYFEAKESPFLSPLLDCKTLTDLKKSYRKLVLEYHPDKTGSDNNEIRMITSTYLRLLKQIN